MTVEEMIKALERFPKDAIVHPEMSKPIMLHILNHENGGDLGSIFSDGKCIIVSPPNFAVALPEENGGLP